MVNVQGVDNKIDKSLNDLIKDRRAELKKSYKINTLGSSSQADKVNSMMKMGATKRNELINKNRGIKAPIEPTEVIATVFKAVPKPKKMNMAKWNLRHKIKKAKKSKNMSNNLGNKNSFEGVKIQKKKKKMIASLPKVSHKSGARIVFPYTKTKKREVKAGNHVKLVDQTLKGKAATKQKKSHTFKKISQNSTKKAQSRKAKSKSVMKKKNSVINKFSKTSLRGFIQTKKHWKKKWHKNVAK